jgi:cation:H+ antiporter
MLVAIIAAVAGLAVLTIAADHLVIGSGRLAQRLGISAVVVGVVVIGLGTSAPEFVVSGLAARRGDTELAVSNLVGSNILNVTLILGVAALIAPVVVHARIPRREAPLSVASVVLFSVAILAGLGLAVGLVLIAALVAALGVLLRLARTTPMDAVGIEAADLIDSAAVSHSTGREAVRVVLGLAGTLGGAQLLVVNASSIATRLGISKAVIGFTLVAFGTSLPELMTSIQAQRRSDTDLVVGNLLGSNLFNSLAGGAIAALAGHRHPARLAYPILFAMVTVSVLSWVLLHRGNKVSRGEAVLLLVAYLATIPLIV